MLKLTTDFHKNKTYLGIDIKLMNHHSYYSFVKVWTEMLH